MCVMIPAHNEAGSVAATIASLRRQTRPPDRIVVVADNCDDDTEEVALLAGAAVMRTVGNTAKKAGALNQGLRAALPGLSYSDLVLTIDADSRLSPQWIESAAGLLASERRAGAVCGVYRGDAGSGLLRQLQRNEFARAARSVTRLPAVRVLSGCGTLFRVSALREVAARRGTTLPGRVGECFSAESLTEDHEITLALKTLGSRCLCSRSSVAFTEVMPTLPALWRQRVRWQMGSLNDLRTYGWSAATWRDWAAQATVYGSYALAWVCWGIIARLLASGAGLSVRWGIAVAGVFLLERVWTSRAAGPRGVALALLILPELCFSLVEAAWLGWSAYGAAARRRASWSHGAGDVT